MWCIAAGSLRAGKGLRAVELILRVALLSTGHFTLVVPALTKKNMEEFFSCLPLGTYERKKSQFQTLLTIT